MTVSSLDELNGARADDPSFIDLVLPEIGAGKASPADLAALEAKPAATALRVSGLDQRTFEALIERHGKQLRAICFWKCPRVDDLSALGDLADLTHVSYYWNQRATSLWDLSRTPKLKGLQFEDFTRLHHLDGIATASSLEELVFGDKIDVTSTIESLAPVSALPGLRRLSFAVKRIDDGRIQPLGALTGLEYLDCPTNLFRTEQLAWLRARLPETVRSRVLAPLIRLGPAVPAVDGRRSIDVLVVGKRKPFLDSVSDRARVERYVAQFEQLVDRYRDDPTLEPPST